MSRSIPPNPDEFEISVIGPGRGECIVIHLGDNEWCVVDSCIPKGLTTSIAVDYLQGFKNGALDRIKLVVATHWHDDHIRGLASLLQSVPTAEFYCSAALKAGEFATLVGSAAASLSPRSGVDEFAAILGLISPPGTTIKIPRLLAQPKFAMENRLLFDHHSGTRSFPVKVWALSPSDATLTKAYEEIAESLPKVGQVPGSVISRSPNHNSVTLWIEAGPLKALLGADLEHTGSKAEGWSCILKVHDTFRAGHNATYFKVPHHGSKGADSPEVWERMLSKNPIAVVTPYSSAGLPREADLKRLQGRTSALYCTARGTGGAMSRDPVVEKMMRRQVVQRRVLEGPAGHIRVRWPLNSLANPTVENFQGAYKV